MALIDYVGRPVNSAPDIGQVYFICGDRYDVSSPFKRSVNYILSDTVAQTPNRGYDYYTSSPWPDTSAYGHGACNGAISGVDCRACLGVAFPKTLNECPLRVGAQLQLRDCRIKVRELPICRVITTSEAVLLTYWGSCIRFMPCQSASGLISEECFWVSFFYLETIKLYSYAAVITSAIIVSRFYIYVKIVAIAERSSNFHISKSRDVTVKMSVKAYLLATKVVLLISPSVTFGLESLSIMSQC